MPLFNRIAVVVMSGVMLAILAMTIASPKFQQGLDLGTAILGAILAGGGLFLLWLGLCSRARKPDAAEVAMACGAPVGTPALPGAQHP